MRRHISQFDSESLWVLLAAAGASPSVRHKWVRVGHLVELATKAAGLSGKTAGPDVLHDLLDRAAMSVGNIDAYEDYLPEDLRDDVRVRLSNSTLRIGPGDVERPVADIDRALLVAKAIDDVLIDRNGFGVRDLLDVVLGYQDAGIAVFADSWPAAEVDFDADAAVTAEEIAAAKQLLAVGTPADLIATDRHRLALDWITCTSTTLAYDVASQQSPVGRFLRVGDPSWTEPRWLPLHFIPGALGHAVSELAAQVATEPDARRHFAEVAAAEARELLWRFGDVFGPPDYDGAPIASPKNVVQWASSPTGRHFVLVQVMSELSVQSLTMPNEPETLRAARAAAADPANPGMVEMTYGAMTMRPGAEVVPLLVIASPSHIAASVRPGLSAISLDDLRWMAKTADSALDLFNYCRDMSRPDLPYFMGWEAIDIWEWWRSNGKSFWSGGQAPSMISIAPHWGTAEWALAAKRSTVEVALARLGLPALRDLDADPDDDYIGPQLLAGRALATAPVAASKGRHKEPDPVAWSLHISDVPVAVEALRKGWPADKFDFLSDLAIGMSYAFEQITDVWVEAHHGSDVSGYILNLSTSASRAPAGPMLRFAGASRSSGLPDEADGVITVELEVNLDPHLDDDLDVTAAFQTAMADVIVEGIRAAGIPDGTSNTVKVAIMAAAPTFAVETLRPLTSRNDFSHPVPINEALVSVVDRKIAEAVSAADIVPGEYTGELAKDIDRTVLAPTALALLETALAGHLMDELVQFGMEQIERCLAHKSRAQVTAQHATDILSVNWDPLGRLHASENKLNTLRRCIEVALEAALRSAPSGSTPVDDLTWGEILAAARAYLAATTRSEAIHHQVGESVLEITSSFELSTKRAATPGGGTVTGDGSGYDFDSHSYGRARLAPNLKDGNTDKADKKRGASDDAADSPASPVPPGIDDGMLGAFGASATDVFGVLTTAGRWQLKAADPDAVAITANELAEQVVKYSSYPVGVTPTEAKQRTLDAIKLLTSTSADLLAADWKPWHARSRKRRMLIQPLAQRTDDLLVVSPRLCFATASIYLNYLQQGQLPWSQPAPPAALNRVLEATRDARNKALEHQVAQTLEDAGWKVIANIKETKPERLGVPSLQTEIDVVAGRPGDTSIWLLEVKDPSDVFALADIRRMLDRFFLDGKKSSYATQVAKKFADLAPHADAVASALGLPEADPAAPYTVRPMFVTREATPAQFVGSQFPFTPLPNLVELLEDAPTQP